MRGIVIAIVLIFAMSFTASMHEFHLSKSTINFDSGSNTLQVTMHIFIDDLEVALKRNGIENLHIGTEKEDSLADHFISEYIDQKFKLSVDSDTLKQTFLGKELSDDLAAIWCYLEVPILHEKTSFSVDHSLLMEIFDDQKNIVSIKKDKKRIDDFLFDLNDHQAVLKF